MRRRALAILVPHAVLLVAAWLLVGRDAVAPFGGAGLVTSIVPLLAVIVAGSVRAARGIAGAKSLLIAPDLGIAALAGATWALANPRLVDDPGLAVRRDDRGGARVGLGGAPAVVEHGRGS